ncbi:MAG: tRNA pseudouridine(55) synthase TruB [Trueperaceae bacterium]|nr:tRNA pseudouridine(55) synthase TruB [Trueperaceae bacterium]
MSVLCIDKPLGPSSHDVVAVARRALATRRVGHAGTLDPLATGLLLVLSEEATKLSPFLTSSDKGYLAWIAFGVGTPTLDAEGPIDARADADDLDAAAVAAALPAFLEVREQVPPNHSAIQRDGVRAYAAARRGDMEALPPRAAEYRRLELLAFSQRPDDLPTTFAPGPSGWRPDASGRPFERPPPLAPAPVAIVALDVRAGTYVRAFARDLGVALGLPAHLAGLVRTRAGAVDLALATPLERITDAPAIDPVPLLPFERVALDAAEVERVRDGGRLEPRWSGRAALVAPDGSLVAVADAGDGDRARFVRVWRSAP